MKATATYEVNRNGKSEYYRTLREATLAAAGLPVWKIINGTATLYYQRSIGFVKQ